MSTELDVDFLDLVHTWHDTGDCDAAITWSATTGWSVEVVTADHEHPDCRFLTKDARLIVVRDGWIAGTDRFTTDPVYGFGPDSGSAEVVASWLCSHTDEVGAWYATAMRMIGSRADLEVLDRELETRLASVRW